MTQKEEELIEDKTCFVLMPISDAEGYPIGHFRHVYQNIIKPACEMAGFSPIRADEVRATNLIHLDILKKLLEAPIAICDLSSRNPNVLFELGIRQAFDKPVVLVKDTGTPDIFDVAPLRYTNYSREMRYHDVVATQSELCAAIKETVGESGGTSSINSIVTLLSLSSAAALPNIKGNKDAIAFDLVQNEIRSIRSEIRSIGAYTREALNFARRRYASLDFSRQESEIDSRSINRHELIHSLVNYERSSLGKSGLAIPAIDRISSAIDVIEDLKLPPEEMLSLTDTLMADILNQANISTSDLEREALKNLTHRTLELRSRLSQQIAKK